MAAACNVMSDVVTGNGVNAELLEAHIVAQAITELQEVHVPNNQGVITSEEAVLNGDEQTDLPLPAEPGQTHLIYYIEAGTVTGSEERTLVDTSVQANDYDIERRSGKVPARKRVIPVKFRDYKNTSADEESDSDYDPHEYLGPRSRRVKVPKTENGLATEKSRTDTRNYVYRRGVGRPRKNFFPDPSVAHYSIIEGKSEEVEKKLQEAIVASMEEVGINMLVKQEVGEKPLVTVDVSPGLVSNEQEQSDTETQGVSDDGNHGDENAPSEMVKSLHGMKTRGVRVNIPGVQPTSTIDKSDVLPGSRGRGRPRLANLPYYKCTVCEKTFKQKGNLKAHLRLHIVGNQFICREEGCNKTYRSNESLRRHLLTHQGIKPFQCDICEQRFSSNVSLTEHRSRHLDEKPYQCQECKKCFRQISCFRRHLMTHSQKLPYQCQYCDKRFAQTAYLKSHVKVHTGEKPFACSICGKRFAHQSDVKRHSTTHTGEKRYSCSKCNAKFSDVSSKNRHEREHENIKRYTCSLCSDSFKRLGQMRSHLNKKHSQAFPLVLNGDQGRSSISFKMDVLNTNSVNSSQPRILSLIKNLHSKALRTDGQTEVISQTLLQDSDQTTAIPSSHVTDITNLEEVDASVIEGDIQVEVQGDDNCQTFIAITDLAESLSALEKDSDGLMRYKLLYEVDENGEQKQILVPYDQAEEGTIQLEYNTLVPSTVNEDTVATETVIEPADSQFELQSENANLIETENCSVMNNVKKAINVVDNNVDNNLTSVESELVSTNDSCHIEANDELGIVQGKDLTDEIDVIEAAKSKTDVSVAGGIDFVNNPDFSKQEFYNWLTNFTEYCKVVPMPLDVSLFQKISQVHKTLSDVMATPCGVVADKENFRVLMTISKDLSTIINEHLVYVLQNLNDPEKQTDNIQDGTSSV